MKRCPFCGKEPECVNEYEYTGLHQGGYAWFVRCNYLNGGCGAKSGSRMTEQEAIEAWEMRTECQKN